MTVKELIQALTNLGPDKQDLKVNIQNMYGEVIDEFVLNCRPSDNTVYFSKDLDDLDYCFSWSLIV